jgi:hypothetical protein
VANIVAQNPGSTEVQSPLIAGITEALNKVSAILNMETTAYTDVALTAVPIDDSTDNLYRIFEAPDGQRLWLSDPAPVIKKNGSAISATDAQFTIDYVGGSITFAVTSKPSSSDKITASFTCIKNESAFLNSLSKTLSATKENADKYKGNFDTLSALNLAYSTASNGDYAIVLSPLAIYAWKDTAWTNTQSIEDLSVYYTKTETDSLLGKKENSIPAQGTGTSSDNYYYGGRKTWQDVNAKVRSTTLTGIDTTATGAISASDTVLTALGKTQSQLDSSANKHFITGTGAPTTTTVGVVGMRYVNTSNGDEYTCTEVSDGAYTWKIHPKSVNGVEPAIGGNITLTAANVGAYTQSETDTKVATATSKTYTLTVSASSWSATGTEGTDSYYRCSVSCSGMTASTQLSCIELTDSYKTSSDAVTAYQTWSYLNTAANYVYFYSATKPTATFAITAIVVK